VEAGSTTCVRVEALAGQWKLRFCLVTLQVSPIKGLGQFTAFRFESSTISPHSTGAAIDGLTGKPDQIFEQFIDEVPMANHLAKAIDHICKLSITIEMCPRSHSFSYRPPFR
jgi:hypothetical protein